jgi:pimeloyl-ACP methyl ester carboxylesterase
MRGRTVLRAATQRDVRIATAVLIPAVLAGATLMNGPAGRLWVDDGGSGHLTPVVFIHSLAGSTEQWAPQLAHVRRTRRAVALDLRGHGRSDPARDGKYGPSDYAADVQAILETLRIDRAIVVGHSMGGGVAIALAGQATSRVAGLLLVDPIDDPSKRTADPNFERFLSAVEGSDYRNVIGSYWKQILENSREPVRKLVAGDLDRTPKDTVVRSMRGMMTFNAESALATYRAPMLTITTPMNDFPSSLHKVITGLRRETITGTSHWVHLDKPDDFNRTLDRFLAQADAAR